VTEALTGALVLGVDCSTTACKAVAWDSRGQPVGEGRASFALENPEPDGYEQDAELWWQSSCDAIRGALRGLGPKPPLAAVCFTHQRETFVVTDAGGKPLHRALVWMDARCRAEVEHAVERLGEERLHATSGKPACTTPSLYKLMFLLGRARPELRALSPRVLDVHAFLVWRMTGRFATSLASADPLGLIDMQARAFSTELLGLAGLERSAMPSLVEPGVEIGRVTPAAAAATGLEPGLPVIAGAGDGQAAGLGAGVAGAGRAYLNLGTAVVAGVLSAEYRVDRAFRTLYGATPGSFFLESDLKGGTFTLSWLAQSVLGTTDVDELLARLETEAGALPPGSDGLVLVPYWNAVMNPYWDDDATGIGVGWHGAHRPAHVYRALLEGIAFEQRLCLSAIEKACATRIDELVVMGGGAKSALFCQVLADVLGKRIVRSKTSEATALGAGIMAAVATGIHADFPTAVAAMTATAEAFEPGAQQSFYRQLYEEVYVGLYPALRDRLRALARLRAEAALSAPGREAPRNR
jgi:xylulokinase